MKRLLLLPASLLALTAQAQNYRPFRPGLLYQLGTAAGDTTIGLRLEKAGYLLGLDSAYAFNTRLAPAPGGQAAGCAGYQFYNGAAGPFGAEMRIRTVGGRPEYWFYPANTATGGVFVLKPGAPLNQAWSAAPSLTARVTARGVMPVLGQPDSVVTITFDNGRTLRLSKQWGFVDGSALHDYLAGRSSMRQLTLTGLPTKRLGQVRLGALAMYDFQPGEVFWYSYSSFNGQGPWPPGPGTQYGDSIISRTNSRNGDTITYRIARGTADRQVPWTVRTLVVTDADQPELLLPTGRYQPASATATNGNWTLDMAPLATYYNGRGLLKIRRRYRHCIGGSRMWVTTAPVESDANYDFVPGLGKVRDYEGLGWAPHYVSTTLIGYRKRGIPTPANPAPAPEQWGTVPRFGGPLLRAADYRPAVSTAAFPNPFERELTVRFESQRAQPVTLELRNALGQLVHAQTTAVAAGTPQLTLQLPALPAGLYTLQLRHDGRTEVLKVTAAP
jgi:Secretion system C-terminal sorting domain